MLMSTIVIAVSGCSPSSEVTATFVVEGMHCESCSSAITEALLEIDGVELASADHGSGSAQATFTAPGVTAEMLKTEIENLGYTVTGVETATAPR
jgi:copper chaperone CopZ